MSLICVFFGWSASCRQSLGYHYVPGPVVVYIWNGQKLYLSSAVLVTLGRAAFLFIIVNFWERKQWSNSSGLNIIPRLWNMGCIGMRSGELDTALYPALAENSWRLSHSLRCEQFIMVLIQLFLAFVRNYVNSIYYICIIYAV